MMLSDGTISECAENGNAAWISAFPDSSAETELFYGHPYVSCTPPRDVVGVKTAVLSVAGQSITLARGLLLSRCYTELINGDEFKYYGTNGQLCAICPSPGAFCVNGSREEQEDRRGELDQAELVRSDVPGEYVLGRMRRSVVTVLSISTW